MSLVTTKIKGISHLTTSCLQVIHVRQGALNGLKSDLAGGPRKVPKRK